MKVQRTIYITILSAFLLLSNSNLLYAANPFEMGLCVPMQQDNATNLKSNFPYSSSRQGCSIQPSSTSRPSYYGSAQTNRPSVNHRSYSSRTTYTPASSLSLGYSSVIPFLHSNSSIRRFAPPSGSGGGAIGNAIANWIETNGTGAYLYSDNGVKYYNMNTLQQLFESLGGLNDMPDLTWDEFLQWFNNNNQTQYRAPIGEPLIPLLFCLLAYAILICCRIQQPTKHK